MTIVEAVTEGIPVTYKRRGGHREVRHVLPLGNRMVAIGSAIAGVQDSAAMAVESQRAAKVLAQIAVAIAMLDGPEKSDKPDRHPSDHNHIPKEHPKMKKLPPVPMMSIVTKPRTTGVDAKPATDTKRRPRGQGHLRRTVRQTLREARAEGL